MVTTGLFRGPSPTPYNYPFPQTGGSQPPAKHWLHLGFPYHLVSLVIRIP